MFASHSDSEIYVLKHFGKRIIIYSVAREWVWNLGLIIVCQGSEKWVWFLGLKAQISGSEKCHTVFRPEIRPICYQTQNQTRIILNLGLILGLKTVWHFSDPDFWAFQTQNQTYTLSVYC